MNLKKFMLCFLILVCSLIAQENKTGEQLFQAIINKRFDIAKILIESGADLNYYSSFLGYTLTMTIFKEKVEIAEQLINSGAKVMDEMLIIAIKTKNLNMVKLLIEKGIDVNHDASPKELLALGREHYREAYGMAPKTSLYPIEYAVQLNDLAMAKLLIKRGARVNNLFKDRRRFSLLKDCSSLDMAKLLVAAGADVKGKKNDDGSLCHRLIYNGSVKSYKIMAYLIKQGTIPSQKLGNIAVGKILRYNRPWRWGDRFKDNNELFDVLSLLFKSGISVNQRYDRDLTLLTWAIKERQIEYAKFFIKQGADVNLKDPSGKTPLDYALVYSNADFVRFLMGEINKTR